MADSSHPYKKCTREHIFLIDTHVIFKPLGYSVEMCKLEQCVYALIPGKNKQGNGWKTCIVEFDGHTNCFFFFFFLHREGNGSQSL